MDGQTEIQSSIKFIAEVTPYGDLICSYCSCQILTPRMYMLKEGKANCPLCSRSFILSGQLADVANANKEHFFVRNLINV
jgi:uncharacterized Zn-finger protein